MPNLPPTISGDLFYDGVWNNATSYLRATEQIDITRGLTSEGNQPDPNEVSALLDNRSGDLSPRNPNSPLFGKIGRNTPIRIKVDAGKPWLEVPNAAGDARARVAYSSALDIPGDIDVRVEAQLDNWNNGSITELIARNELTGDQRSWRFLQLANGTIEFTWTTAGTAASGISIVSSQVLRVPPNQRIALRATLDVNNGSGGYTVTFYTAPKMAGPWTQFGTQTVTTAGTTSIFTSTAPLDVGDANGIALTAPIGRFYAAQVRSGIDGTLVANADFTSRTVGDTTWVDSAGRTWITENGATISNTHIRIVGEVPAWPPRRSLSGTDVRVPVSPAGILRRLGSGSKPLKSAAFRSITFNNPDAPIREYWPMEDGPEATAITSGLENGILATITGGIDMAASTAFASSDHLPTMGTSVVHMTVRPYTATTSMQMRFLLAVPSTGTTDGAILARISTTGTARTFKLQYNVGGGLTLIMYDDDGTRLDDTGPISFGVNGKLLRVSIGLTQSGANVAITLGTLEPNASSALVSTDTLVSGTIGSAVSMSVGSPDDLGQTVMGHVTFQSAETNLFDVVEQLDAYTGETAGARIIRLCSEQGVTASYPGDGTGFVTLGPQRINKFVDLLTEAATSDQGFMLEARDALELFYRPRASLYNQTPGLTLDYSQGLITAPFEPTDDDKLTRNSVIVTVDGGSSSPPAVLDSGALSIQDPPNGVGLYDIEYTYSLEKLQTAEDLSMWLLHTGTFDGLRYTSITLDLANERVADIATDIMNVDIGDLIRLTDLPDDLPPGDVDLIVIGYSETMGPSSWKIKFICIPGEPYNVAMTQLNQNATNANNRADTSSSTLFVAVDTDDTSFQVLTPDTYDKWCEAFPVVSTNAAMRTGITNWNAQGGSLAWADAPGFPLFDTDKAAQFISNGSSTIQSILNNSSAAGTIIPGLSYYANGWIYATSIIKARIAVNWADASNVYLSTSSGSTITIPANTWTYLSGSLTAPASSSRAGVHFSLDDEAGSGSIPASVGVYGTEARLRQYSSGFFQQLCEDDFPLSLSISGEVVRADSCMPIIYDGFDRTSSSTWGTSNSGHVYTNAGGSASDYSVASGQGRHTCTTTNVSRISTINKGYTDADLMAYIAANAVSTGASQFGNLVARYTDSSNYYYARVEFQTDTDIIFTLRKRVAGVDTELAVARMDLGHVAGRFYGVRFEVRGSTLRGKIWDTTVDNVLRPWELIVTDTDLTTGGSVGTRSIVSTTNTNVNPVIAYDNFVDRVPQVFVVERSRNGVVKSIAANEDISVADPAIVAL